jgi:DNA-directed RNA polymerase specialized sigma24 family protein
MTDYLLRFDHLDGDTAIRPLTVSADTAASLAQEVHRHARGRLGSRSVDVHLDEDALTGAILRNGITVGEFTLDAAPVSTSRLRGDLVLHGYTLTDIHNISRYVVRYNRWYNAADIQDRFDAAWHAIVEHLLAADEKPTDRDLFHAGRTATDREMRQSQQAHGYNYHQPGTGTRPNFERYWFTTAAPTPSPENRVVEREALGQIWPNLTPRQQEALTALAATGDYRLAAEALDITQGTLHVLLSKARKRFLACWHEGEEPSKPWGTDRRIGDRAATAPAKTKRRAATRAAARRTGRPTRELVHGRASTYTNHACRCVPCTQAATDKARERNRAKGATPRQFKGRPLAGVAA